VDVLAVTSKDLTKEWWIHIVTGTDQIKNKSVVWELRGSSATSLLPELHTVTTATTTTCTTTCTTTIVSLS